MRAKLQKVPDAIAPPHGVYAIGPEHGVFVQISNIAANGRLIVRIMSCRDAAEHGYCRRVHFKGIEPALREIAQDAHARMMKSQAHIEQHGWHALFAQGSARFGKGLARAAQDELARRIAVGNIQFGPGSQNFVNNCALGMHGHHASIVRGGCFQLGHVFGAGVKDAPGLIQPIDASQRKRNKLAKAVAAKKRRRNAQRCELAPLGIFQQKKIGYLAARVADDFCIALVHKTEHIPVSQGCNAVHGLACSGKIVIKLAAHARPHRAKAATHDGQVRGGNIWRKPDATPGQGLQRLGIWLWRKASGLFPPERRKAAKTPESAVLAKTRIAHSVQRRFNSFGAGFICLRFTWRPEVFVP